MYTAPESGRKELGIISPLAELHITKAQVKALASEYGISVASRPSTPPAWLPACPTALLWTMRC